MKKMLFFAAIALAALGSCTSDEFVGEKSLQDAKENGAISFNYQFQNATRGESDHATSAANLGNQFIVWGEKSTGTADTKDAPADGHIVFPNYQVNYTTNTAYTTTSNTTDWEYVGFTHSTNYQNNIKYKATSSSAAVAGSSAAQTIKYWDYSAGSYTFTAVSASKLDANSKTDIENGYITIQKNIDGVEKASEKGYTITVTANADLTKLYFSDRTIITQNNAGTDRTAVNTYGGNVTLKFRNALSQIRAGIYETISGYAISDIKFYVNNTDASPAQTVIAKAGATSANAFGAICPNIKGTGYAGELTVTYSEENNTSNHPVVSASGTVNNNLILGTNISSVTTTTPLGTTATHPTWDTSDGAFTTVLLQGSHTTNLKLKCDYTLYNSVSGETIEVKGATAEVPYQYLQWKPNYKYTYLFKINDNTNGSTGQDVVGLYPITFDAIEITNGDGVAEYITTVSEPSITTFGVKNGKYTTGKDEYETGTDIYITIVQNNAVVNPAFMSDTHLYKVTTSDATNFPITEASVAEAFDHPTNNKITVGSCICTPWSNVSKASKVTSVPAEDGTTISIAGAIKFSPATGDEGTYAVQYSYGSTDYTYTVINTSEFVDNETSVAGLYLRSEEQGAYTYTFCGDDAKYESGKTYCDRIVSGTSTKRVYKIIKVVAAPSSGN